ncbi:hypothetical protein GYMLUDRAFT_879425 [Collybiopsis luxurians FD-317 M1]|uniref:Uncharacterized protein n=1 Tax=Collybiopsis luxurians FD-317 M1 TaxID=944289 RepID=A0A0D0BKI0_9AGAR|nr:hypothetical protein GYMLUDRAFT_879425 [Collybiopsis luxurians FD-317 M1]
MAQREKYKIKYKKTVRSIQSTQLAHSPRSRTIRFSHAKCGVASHVISFDPETAKIAHSPNSVLDEAPPPTQPIACRVRLGQHVHFFSWHFPIANGISSISHLILAPSPQPFHVSFCRERRPSQCSSRLCKLPSFITHHVATGSKGKETHIQRAIITIALPV